MAKTRADEPPHIFADYGKPEAAAIQALVRGEATPEQQRRGLQWIIERASGMYEFHYHPTDRDTAFALGRARVGQLIVKLSKLNLMSFKEGA